MLSTDRALALEQLGAPSVVVSLARLFDLAERSTGMERTAKNLLKVYADVVPGASVRLNLLPEIEAMLKLDQALPSPLRLADDESRSLSTTFAASTTLPRATSVSTVVRVVEALTPPIVVPAAFARAVLLADDPAQWAKAAPQIEVANDALPLPANGALKRWRLTKRTNLLRPICPGMTTEETIEIKAEGRDGPSGSGNRRYSHFLVSAAVRPDLLRLIEDTGWIELNGGPDGCLLRLQKRVVVAVPVELNERFGSLLPTALATLLWLWGAGFAEALAPGPTNRPQQSKGGPNAKTGPEPKQIRYQGSDVKVAVLGGGPAGLACAWLLSQPIYDGKSAWSAPAENPSLKVEVVLVEKACRLGGKAASGRRVDGEELRIEEHGLHVLMGFYKNLLRVLTAVGVHDDELKNVNKTLVAPAGWDGTAAPWSVTLGPWKTPVVPRGPMIDWLNAVVGPERLDWQQRGVEELFDFRDAQQPPAALPEREDTRGLLLVGKTQPMARPMMRAFLAAWERVAKLAPATMPRPDGRWLNNVAMQIMLRQLMLAEAGSAALTDVRRLTFYQGTWPDDQPPGEGVGPLAVNLRRLARSALSATDADSEVQLVSEILELSTTITIGLDASGMFPDWALDCPADLVAQGELRYQDWVAAIQTLDCSSLSEWLEHHHVAAGFAQRSRILAAVTAGLFTTPDDIGAGTFINGLARLLFTYDDAPYKLMPGGTGEAVIGPIYDALLARGVKVRTGTEVMGLKIAAKDDPLAAAATAAAIVTRQREKEGDYMKRPPGQRSGWSAPAACTKVAPAEKEYLPADAFVLAIPPFASPLDGLPTALATRLQAIESCATVGLQHWTDESPRYPEAIMAGLQPPLRCAAAMTHLAGNEGTNFKQPPVYYCGEVDEKTEKAWSADPAALDAWRNEWLVRYAARFQGGAQAHPPHPSFNHKGSERYVCANVPTQAARCYPHETGVSNLWLAGDWTRTALSCGSIEAAVTSGLEAARDILKSLGCEVHFPIVGACFERKSP